MASEKLSSSRQENDESSVAVVATNNNDNNKDATHKVCEVCQERLPRHLFTRKEFQHSSSTCQQCRRQQTAQRCKQETKFSTNNNNLLGRKAPSGMTRRPNNFGYCTYLDKLFSMKCFPDIVQLQAFTSAKDVSESMAAIQAVTKHGLLAPKKEKSSRRIQCLCIGDGSTPRTAVLACFLKQNWSVISIDPALHIEWQGTHPKGVRGLVGFGGTLEDYMISEKEKKETEEFFDYLVLLCVHSHARFVGTTSIAKIRQLYQNNNTIPTTLVSLPCCPKFRSHRDIGRPPDIQYDDDCVFSACRKVEVWNFLDAATAITTTAIANEDNVIIPICMKVNTNE